MSASERTGRIVPDDVITGRLSICWVRTFAGAGKHEVEALSVDRDLRHAQPVVEDVHRLPKLAHAYPAVREAGSVGSDAYFGGAELEPRPRPYLGPSGPGQGLKELPHGAAGNLQDRLEIGTLDIEIDALAAADGAPEEGRLAHESEGAGLPEHRTGQYRDEISCPVRLRAGRADEGPRRGRDEEEVLDPGRWAARFTRSGTREGRSGPRS